MTEYSLLRHRRSGQMWAVRLEGSELTGVFGPVVEGVVRPPLPDLPYDEDDDLAEWVIRYLEEFTRVESA